MLRPIKNLLGYTAHAIDGDAGKIVDFYFDDDDWNVRYLVIETGDLLLSERILISSLAIMEPDHRNRICPVSVTIDKILRSPEINTDLPLSRQFEMALRRYYEWPVYWGQVSFLDNPKNGRAVPHIPVDEALLPDA
jgi:hypothetical protein